MTISWYSIIITPLTAQSGAVAIFNGYFSVDNYSNLLTGFYDYTNIGVNILIPTGTGTISGSLNGFTIYNCGSTYDNAYKSHWKQFDFYGIIISSFPGCTNNVNIYSPDFGGETANNIAEIASFNLYPAAGEYTSLGLFYLNIQPVPSQIPPYNILKYCTAAECQKTETQKNLKKFNTATNSTQQSKAMRYAQYIRQYTANTITNYNA